MMKKIKFDRPLSAAFSPNVPTTIKEYDTTHVEERIRAIRATFTTLTESIKQLENRFEATQQQIESRVRELAMEIVRGFSLTDEAMISERLTRFIDDVQDIFNPKDSLKIYVNAETATLIPQLLEDTENPPQLEIDAGLQNGECRVESDGQGLFMSLDAQLNQVRKRMMHASRNGSL